MKILVSIFLLISSAAFGQVYQRQTAPFEFTRGLKPDSILVIPRGCDTVAMPRIKWGAPSIGALYYDTCANTLYVKDSWGWMPVTGGLDSAAFAPVIDSTGQRFYRVLFAVNNKISGSDKFTYDSLLNYLLITGKVEADSLIINGGAEFIGSTYIDDLEAYNLRVTNTAPVYDTTNYKIGVINTSTGRVERFAYWPANGGGGDYVDTIYRKPGRDSIFYTINGGTERAIKDSIGGGGGGTDTTSLSNRINLKLNISDTATMLAPYITDAEARTAINDSAANFIRNGTTQEQKRFNVRTGRLDSLLAASSAGLNVYSNAGTLALNIGAGGGSQTTHYGFAGYNANIAANYTVRSFTDKNYVDSSLLNKLNISDTAGLRAKQVLSFAKNATRDSAILTLFDGTRFPVRDSVGGGFVSDSLAIRRRGTNLQNIVSFNTTSNGTAGTVTADSATIAIGGNALRSVTSGQGNIGIGSNVGLSNTTGQWNIAIGKKAFETSQTGNSNIAIGNEALLTSNGVSDQIAIGRNALRLNATGTANTAVGATALSVATGSNNTAFGNSVMFGLSTGARNTGVGVSAGSELTTGTDNTSIGYWAGRTVTSGANNTSVGSSAGANGAAAKNNTVSVGFEAGRYTAESLSTWLGVDAGQGASGNLHTGGSYNLGLGYRTMYDVTGVRTGSSNTAIGDRINLPSRTSSNQFVYGSNGINWLTRFTDGGWLINYTASAVTAQTASAALEVNGTTGAVLFPRLTTNQITALTGANGMIVYNTTTNKFQGFAAGGWVDLH
jgi:hypothetical protein